MPLKSPLTLAAYAAIAAGLLRIASGLTPAPVDPALAEALYLVIDLLFLFGLFGVYAQNAEAAGWTGLVGFAIAASGIAIIAGPESDPWGFSTYLFGSGLFLAGMAALSIGLIGARQWLWFAPFAWLAAFAAAIVGAASPQLPFAQDVAGLAVGLGFVLAGLAQRR
jgi:NAD/NADP transhydrogenase beta subunit